ncbi:MAG: PD-(D/E)XK nuclease family protein [Amoebophilaceae bacterium]|nr:PD-(D/E)XK nuclease family protein [Amoebophilaceae bacterium]
MKVQGGVRPFLLPIIEQLAQDPSHDFQSLLFIFPTDLSIDYFHSLYSYHSANDRPKCITLRQLTLYSDHSANDGPKCITLRQLMLDQSHLKAMAAFVLLQKLYGVVKATYTRYDTFDAFYPFGVTLLQDFDLLDHYLIGAPALFSALIRQKELTVSWEQLPLIYQQFKQQLIAEGIGYPGLCYRAALDGDLYKTLAGYQKLIFIGFNELVPVEEQFVVACQKLLPSLFFWDVDSYYLDNPMHAAGYYLRRHQKNQVFKNSFPKQLATYLNDPHKHITITAASSLVPAIQLVIDVLQEKINKQKIPLHQAAIVVNGTDVVVPLLDKLAKLAIPLHCRIPYPLKATAIYSLVEKLVTIWEQATNPILADDIANLCLSMHPLVDVDMQEKIMRMVAGANFFTDLPSKGFWVYLQGFLVFLLQHFTQSVDLFLAIQRDALQFLIDYIASFLQEELSAYRPLAFLQHIKDSSFLFSQHHPSTGLYIVELTAAHNLDFAYAFFVPMNEAGSSSGPSSFFPYAIRSSFGLPIADKVAERSGSYGFYRLLQRSQTVYCSYSAQHRLGSSGEMSRLLLQLLYSSKVTITTQQAPLYLSPAPAVVIAVDKDEKVMQWLEKFLVKENKGEATLTPSALISYLSCSLQFYFTYLLRLKKEEPNNQDNKLQLGILFHAIMEQLYKPFVGIEISTKVISQLKSKVKITIQKVMDRYEAVQPIHDAMLLSALLEKLVGRMLAIDHSHAPFTLMGVELGRDQPMGLSLPLDQARVVRLGGIIDRVDSKEGSIRIIDYKTGAPPTTLSSIADLWDPTQIKKNKAMLQLIFYTWLFKSIDATAGHQMITPYLIPLSALFATSGTKIEDITPYMQPFQEKLIALLSNLFDPKIPFIQTENLEICSHCPYVAICQRGHVAKG